LDYTFLKYYPSVVAACSVALALHTCRQTPWTPTLSYYSGYSFAQAEMKACLVEMYSILQSSLSNYKTITDHDMYASSPKSSHQAIKEKYVQPRFLKVAEILPPSSPPNV
jgi:hypothetical protein